VQIAFKAMNALRSPP